MSGYTPVFNSVFDGTMCGRWPTLPVWLTLLPLADRHGRIDMTLQAISARSGWPIELLRQAIDDLMQPDSDSRSGEFEGRRLIPLDPNRNWGWIVVNHAKYAEKARQRSQSQAQVIDGRNAAKVRKYKQKQKELQTPPDTTGHHQTPSTSASATVTINPERVRARETVSRETRDELIAELRANYPPGIWTETDWQAGEHYIHVRLDNDATPEQLRNSLAEFRQQQFALGYAGTQYVCKPIKFWSTQKWRGPFPLPKSKAQVAQDANIAASQEWLARSEEIDATK